MVALKGLRRCSWRSSPSGHILQVQKLLQEGKSSVSPRCNERWMNWAYLGIRTGQGGSGGGGGGGGVGVWWLERWGRKGKRRPGSVSAVLIQSRFLCGECAEADPAALWSLRARAYPVSLED